MKFGPLFPVFTPIYLIFTRAKKYIYFYQFYKKIFDFIKPIVNIMK